MNVMYMVDKTDRKDKLEMIRHHSTTRHSANLNRMVALLEIENKSHHWSRVLLQGLNLFGEEDIFSVENPKVQSSIINNPLKG